MKNYLIYENDRNKHNKHVLTDYVQRALGKTCDVLVVHHITFTRDCDEDGNEIPSADTLLFDHDFAKKVFGDAWRQRLCDLALTPAEEREALLERMLFTLDVSVSRSTHLTEVA